jgi:hypothetical protein
MTDETALPDAEGDGASCACRAAAPGERQYRNEAYSRGCLALWTQHGRPVAVPM